MHKTVQSLTKPKTTDKDEDLSR